mmetsp:Transcript_88776/g.177514  ORF Transcript_88776/g.177514 Transcript_88776/m.177514 type:complete len:213 (-) Transcript_88776:519-1157(-)
MELVFATLVHPHPTRRFFIGSTCGCAVKAVPPNPRSALACWLPVSTGGERPPLPNCVNPSKSVGPCVRSVFGSSSCGMPASQHISKRPPQYCALVLATFFSSRLKAFFDMLSTAAVIFLRPPRTPVASDALSGVGDEGWDPNVFRNRISPDASSSSKQRVRTKRPFTRHPTRRGQLSPAPPPIAEAPAAAASSGGDPFPSSSSLSKNANLRA